MSGEYINEPMLEMFIFESTQLLEQLEQMIITGEKSKGYTPEDINEIFRIMHTIKGSSAMMLFDNISSLAHSLEDIFYFLREERPQGIDFSVLSDIVFDGIDFIKVELAKIKNGDEVDGDASVFNNNSQTFLASIKDQKGLDEDLKKVGPDPVQQQYYISKIKAKELALKNAFQATLYFEDESGMENLRAFGVVNDLHDWVEEFYCEPGDLDKDDTSQIIKEEGFKVFLKTNRSFDEVYHLLEMTVFLKELQLLQLDDLGVFNQFYKAQGIHIEENSIKIPSLRSQGEKGQEHSEVSSNSHQSIISVNVAKLDKLMDLVGELVIAEAMVTQNPDLKGLDLTNFQKAARQLRKISSEIQDTVMSVRMVPLTATFQKMQRTVRDMCKKLDKEVQLKLIGEETEVDKNIIEHISDPLMHLIRNAIDHGIESPEVRETKGKPHTGTITLEAKSSGSDVLIIVRDDGEGFNKEKILGKARKSGLLQKPENEMSDKEIYNLVFLPGFSTNEIVTEFSGRGVGMDVVMQNIQAVGGNVTADGITDHGTTITLKIPLTLAIIEGMNVRVGNSRYTLPLTSIRESFRPKKSDVIIDPDRNEMIMVRGQCYPVLRLHEFYHVKTQVTEFTNGIIIRVEQDGKGLCLFGDELLGQQQVVVKALPKYIKNTRKITGLGGCTLLGDGGISLILDIAGLIEGKERRSRRGPN